MSGMTICCPGRYTPCPGRVRGEMVRGATLASVFGMASKPTTHDSPNSKSKSKSKSRSEPRPLHEAIVEYAGDEADELPIGGYAAMMSVFLGSFVGLVAVARATRTLPERVAVRDIALLGVATHKLTRIVTRERVTIPLRVPFARYEGRDGAGQVKEEPRGEGVQRAIGSLLTCQYCAGPWVATGLVAGLLFAPRATRLACGVLSVVAISDFLHQAYAGTRRWSR